MPELPEVETVRRGIEPLICNQTIASVFCRVPKLRWDLCASLGTILPGQTVRSVTRRAKYLLLNLDKGALVVHLGMTGILRVLDAQSEPGKHDHFDLVLANGKCLRLNDSRRFGAVFYLQSEAEKDERFKDLGPEPLSDDFNPEYLYRRSRNRTTAIKVFLMDQKVVVGVGNIYASEALYRSGIAPQVQAGRISRKRFEKLVPAVRTILAEAIEQGGTTIRDFEGTDGKPGYFRQKLQVYGREGEPCAICRSPIRKVRLGGRSTYYCAKCQK